MNALQLTWGLLIGVLLTGYVILDGFDLGVGFWYLFARKDEERRSLLAAIAPFWDGNEVWLVAAGGALFAAFPHAYATVFSGFYLPLMMVVVGLIFRAVSIEFRNESASLAWRKLWDAGFAFGSMVPALLFGVAAGNLLRGLPLDDSGNFAGSLRTLLNPYALLVGGTGLAMFATHGALYIATKTEGELEHRARRWAHRSWMVYVILLIGTVIATILGPAHLFANAPAVVILLVVAGVAVGFVGLMNRRCESNRAFLSSCLAIAALFATMAAAIFPNLAPASQGDPLTIYNASSSPLTLKVMLIVAVIGMPIVLAYQIWVRQVFRGKVGAETSY